MPVVGEFLMVDGEKASIALFPTTTVCILPHELISAQYPAVRFYRYPYLENISLYCFCLQHGEGRKENEKIAEMHV